MCVSWSRSRPELQQDGLLTRRLRLHAQLIAAKRFYSTLQALAHALFVSTGHGSKVSFVNEEDIATYAVLAAGDPLAENKKLCIRPLAKTLSRNEMVALWERKTGKRFEREEAVQSHDRCAESAVPLSVILAVGHVAYVRGRRQPVPICKKAKLVDAGELCLDTKYTTVDEYLDRFL
ncbi:unnamed protein product [Urochloa humidicola]